LSFVSVEYNVQYVYLLVVAWGWSGLLAFHNLFCFYEDLSPSTPAAVSLLHPATATDLMTMREEEIHYINGNSVPHWTFG
jgi:hypothetical protein